jgi:cysteine-rich repeat protein
MKKSIKEAFLIFSHLGVFIVFLIFLSSPVSAAEINDLELYYPPTGGGFFTGHTSHVLNDQLVCILGIPNLQFSEISSVSSNGNFSLNETFAYQTPNTVSDWLYSGNGAVFIFVNDVSVCTNISNSGNPINYAAENGLDYVFVNSTFYENNPIFLRSCGDYYNDNIDRINFYEQCDDGNFANGDGCNSTCALESGYTCTGNPSVCEIMPPSPICGNSIIENGEICDDGNTSSADGCNASCDIEDGFQCAGEPSVCELIPSGAACGDLSCDMGETSINCAEDCEGMAIVSTSDFETQQAGAIAFQRDFLHLVFPWALVLAFVIAILAMFTENIKNMFK